MKCHICISIASNFRFIFNFCGVFFVDEPAFPFIKFHSSSAVQNSKSFDSFTIKSKNQRSFFAETVWRMWGIRNKNNNKIISSRSFSTLSHHQRYFFVSCFVLLFFTALMMTYLRKASVWIYIVAVFVLIIPLNAKLHYIRRIMKLYLKGIN